MDLLDRLRQPLAAHYTVEEEIGRGGMAVVFRAVDLKHQRPVAIKVLRPELSASLGADRFLREIRIAAQLQHPRIVPLYDSGEAGGLLYYVMPFLQGETLRERLDREGPLQVDEALRITDDVAKALDHAHAMDVVHRDVKPENVWLSGAEALVLDFGIARALTEAGAQALTDSGVAIGTPEYMSPEQGAGDAKINGRSDIYSLGCVLFEMLAGEPPFTGPTAQAIIARHMSQEAPSVRVVRSTVPVTVERAIARALSKVPADRFPTALAFVEAARAAPGRERPWRVGVSVLIVAAILALGVWGATRMAGSPDDERTITPAAPSRVAVLYFEDRSADGVLGNFATGLTEDLIDELARIEALSIAPASQVRPFANSDVGSDSIATLLGADVLVEGAVDGAAGSLRVTIRMIDGRTGGQLASHVVRGGAPTVLAVRDSLVTDVVRVLRRSLGEQVEVRRRLAEASNNEAWLLVQRAEEMSDLADTLRGVGDGAGAVRALAAADSLAARADQLDRDWILPLVQRGWYAWRRATLAQDRETGELGGLSATEWVRRGLDHAERALERRAAEARALELRGFLRYQLWNLGTTRQADSLLELAERDLWAAVRWDPAMARAWYSLSRVRLSKGEFEGASVAARTALQKDAFLSEAQAIVDQLYWTALEGGDHGEAARWCQEGRNRFPDNPNFVECRLTVLGWYGDTPADVDEAWSEVRRIDSLEFLQAGAPYRRLLVANILARGGLDDSARAVIRQTRAIFPGATLYFQEAYVRLLLGETDEALRLLGLTVQLQPRVRDYLANHHWFRSLRDSERFRRITGVDTP